MELSILMKIAETNKETAWSSYNQKFGTTPVRFDDRFYHARNSDGYRINPNNKTICIEDFEYLTKFLCNFGHLVMDFTIERSEESRFQWTNVINLVASRCTALKKLRLCNDVEDDMIELVLQSSSRVQEMSQCALRIATVFPTVESLEAEKVYFETGMKLDVCFPNLSSLNLLTISASEPSMFEVHFPKLEHLGIMMTGEEEYEEEDDYDCFLNRINIENMMKLNPQLNSIWLEMEMDVPFFEFIKETLPNLQKVDFQIGPDNFDGYCGGDVVIKSVTKASLGQLGKRRTPVIFENLKELIAEPVDNQFTVDYIKKYRYLTSLNLTCEYNDEKMIQLIRALPDLQELHVLIDRKKWSVKGVLRFLALCERLNSVYILVNIDSSEQMDWRSKVASIWKIKNEFDDECYVIEKTGSTD